MKTSRCRRFLHISVLIVNTVKVIKVICDLKKAVMAVKIMLFYFVGLPYPCKGLGLLHFGDHLENHKETGKQTDRQLNKGAIRSLT